MKLKITRAAVWAADIEDRPGGLAEKLGALAKAGTNLDFILARERPGQADRREPSLRADRDHQRQPGRRRPRRDQAFPLIRARAGRPEAAA